MIVVTKGIQKDIYVTLNESVTLTNPYFLFVFTNISTKEVLKVIVNSTDDKSNYPERVNQFEIDVDLFDELSTGQWSYNIYEQLSSSNLNPTGLNLLENGKMLLKDSSEVTDYSATYAPQTKYV
jgi:hypothetical protein